MNTISSFAPRIRPSNTDRLRTALSAALLLAACTGLTAVENARPENAPELEKKSRHTKLPTHAPAGMSELGRPVVAHSALQDRVLDPDFVHRGSSPAEVEARLGPASVTATPDVWVYWDYRLSGKSNAAPDCDTLLVVFREGVVARLRLVNSASARGLLAQVGQSHRR